MGIPTEADWGDWQADLDQQSAHETFGGRSASEVAPRFRHNVIERTSELRFMPPVAFRYYLLAFRDYVLSEAAGQDDASDAASCFLNLVQDKLEGDRATIDPIIQELLEAVDYVADNQSAFEAPVHIYGRFGALRARIRDLAGCP